MNRLKPIDSEKDILPEYRDSPIGQLLRYHNLQQEFLNYSRAELLIGMCMDNRKRLNMPENFAYVIRAGGANLRGSEFKVSFAVAIGGVRAMTLIAHSNCGMVNLASKREQFIQNLVEIGGWSEDQATEHFHTHAPLFEIGNEIDFVLSEALRLRYRYPKLLVAPLYYRVEDNRLYHIADEPTR